MPDFFEPGVAYVKDGPFRAPELLGLFRCVAVAEHPAKHEPRALGFEATAHPGDNWVSASFGPAQWAEGWIVDPLSVAPDRYWTIWTADRREVIGQVSGPGLIDADAALSQAADSAYDFEHTKANSYVEETDETGFNLLHDWDALSEDEKADLRPLLGAPDGDGDGRG